MKLQSATSDEKLNGDSAGFGFVHCDRSIIDKFLALKENLKVKGLCSKLQWHMMFMEKI